MWIHQNCNKMFLFWTEVMAKVPKIVSRETCNARHLEKHSYGVHSGMITLCHKLWCKSKVFGLFHYLLLLTWIYVLYNIEWCLSCFIIHCEVLNKFLFSEFIFCNILTIHLYELVYLFHEKCAHFTSILLKL